MEVGIDNLRHQVVSWRVLERNSRPFKVNDFLDMDQIWSFVDVPLKDFSDPPHVSLAINHTFTLNLEVIRQPDLPEVLVSLFVFNAKVVLIGDVLSISANHNRPVLPVG
jgi:hypothetical protein